MEYMAEYLSLEIYIFVTRQTQTVKGSKVLCNKRCARYGILFTNCGSDIYLL